MKICVLLAVLVNAFCISYAEGSSSRAGIAITDSELLSLSAQLYNVDVNKATSSLLSINKQTLIPNSDTGLEVDRATSLLFAYVNEATLFSRPTFKAFITLLDNYDRMTGVTESFTSAQIAEQDAFLQEIMSTSVMKELFKFLQSKAWYSTETEFSTDLKKMWFGLYSRASGKLDSSGFEHIFVGEIKSKKVSGFHNWVQFYLNEKKGLLNYYSHNYDGPWESYPDVLAMQFNWNNYYKSVGSAFIGSSPEFDFAIYTLCFIARPDKGCKVNLGGYVQSIQTYTWTNSFYDGDKRYVASAYPISP
ncbi:poly(U)-specific endoribonuclease [Protopterus annectens]|uniref:poly(U)-specific endoribonuclease n=1 Tax=Protopterus annectens TaxID=7888 RepID=UPI001CFB74A7|nr:poly(U)-specific endoribonuclease [Protopterus annectens]